MADEVLLQLSRLHDDQEKFVVRGLMSALTLAR